MRREEKKVPLEVEVFDLLQQSAMITAREVYRFLSPHKLSVSQFRTLYALNTHGPLSQIDIASRIFKSTGNVTTVIDNLEKRSLVKRVRDEKDRRYFRIELTPEGEKLVKKLLPQQAKRIKQVMERIPGKDLEHLKRICREFISISPTKKFSSKKTI